MGFWARYHAFKLGAKVLFWILAVALFPLTITFFLVRYIWRNKGGWSGEKRGKLIAAVVGLIVLWVAMPIGGSVVQKQDAKAAASVADARSKSDNPLIRAKEAAPPKPYTGYVGGIDISLDDFVAATPEQYKEFCEYVDEKLASRSGSHFVVYFDNGFDLEYDDKKGTEIGYCAEDYGSWSRVFDYRAELLYTLQSDGYYYFVDKDETLHMEGWKLQAPNGFFAIRPEQGKYTLYWNKEKAGTYATFGGASSGALSYDTGYKPEPVENSGSAYDDYLAYVDSFGATTSPNGISSDAEWIAITSWDDSAEWVTTTAPATTTAKPEPKDDVYETTYVLNKSTKVFHYGSCRYAKNLKNSGSTTDRDWAIDHGYSPCKVCRP